MVLDHWSAKSSSILVALKCASGGVEEVLGVQGFVAQKFKRGPMELVGAGLGDYADNRTREASELRIEAVGEQPELLYRIEHGNYARTIGTGIFDRGSIYQKAIRVLTLAIDGKFALAQ